MRSQSVWARSISNFGEPIGISHGVVAYSSEYKKIDRRRFGDELDYESYVEAVVHVHHSEPTAEQKSSPLISVHYHHRVTAQEEPKVLRHAGSSTAVSSVAQTDNTFPAVPHPSQLAAPMKKLAIYAGAKFQCVEYARRFLIMRFHLTFPSIPMAYHILLAMQSFVGFHYTLDNKGGVSVEKQFVRAVKTVNAAIESAEAAQVRNAMHQFRRQQDEGEDDERSSAPDSEVETPHAPVVGTLIIWCPRGYFKHTGHVAVVVAVDGDSVHISEQNVTDRAWPDQDSHARTLRLQTRVDERGRRVYAIDEPYVTGEIWGWVTPLTLLLQETPTTPQK